MEQNIEQKIIQAARTTFLKNGYNETNMSDIASEVGLTRPAMHYYFRTKERLFQAVLGDIVMEFLPKVKDQIISDKPLEEKIRAIVDTYMNVLERNPELPVFMVREVNRDFGNLLKIAFNSDIISTGREILDAILTEMEAGKFRNVKPVTICYTFYGLISAPFLVKPLGEQVFNIDGFRKEFLQEWKENVIRQMTCLLKP
ncbi:MAG: TetR/AcrR family transcriptional regulator [Candidatus Cryptobacteroides sp.]